MDGDTNARLTKLEERAAHQDHLLAQLDEVVQEFSKRVESLERQLSEVVQSIGAEEPVGPADSPPPHY